MKPTRLFSIIGWIALPTVMFGGYSLLNFLVSANALSDFQQTFFRAGHAHAGVLILMALIYDQYLDQTRVSDRFKWIACSLLFVGILATSGGFFLHMLVGQPGQGSAGTALTGLGTAILVISIILLVYALIAKSNLKKDFDLHIKNTPEREPF